MAKKNPVFPQPTDNNAIYALHAFLRGLLESAAAGCPERTCPIPLSDLLCANTRDDDGNTRFPAVALYRFSYIESIEESRCVALQIDIGMSVSAAPVYSYVFRETGTVSRTDRSWKESGTSTLPTWLEGAQAAISDLQALVLAFSQAFNYLLNGLGLAKGKLTPSGHINPSHFL